jgi:hypothetical protein
MQHPRTFRQELDDAFDSAELYTQHAAKLRRRFVLGLIGCALLGAAAALVFGG